MFVENKLKTQMLCFIKSALVSYSIHTDFLAFFKLNKLFSKTVLKYPKNFSGKTKFHFILFWHSYSWNTIVHFFSFLIFLNFKWKYYICCMTNDHRDHFHGKNCMLEIGWMKGFKTIFFLCFSFPLFFRCTYKKEVKQMIFTVGYQ